MTLGTYIGIGILWGMLNVISADIFLNASFGKKLLVLIFHGSLWPLSVAVQVCAFFFYFMS